MERPAAVPLCGESKGVSQPLPYPESGGRGRRSETRNPKSEVRSPRFTVQGSMFDVRRSPPPRYAPSGFGPRPSAFGLPADGLLAVSPAAELAQFFPGRFYFAVNSLDAFDK